MIPILSIVGKSDAGKTFLVERLVGTLTPRGYRIATVKHDVHGFDVDREGKDSWRHKQAGASTVVISSPAKIAVIHDVTAELTLAQIRNDWIRDADLILTEGYKRAGYPKIEVSLFGASDALLCTEDDRLCAVVSDRDFPVKVPRFGAEEMERLGDWIEARFLARPRRERVEIRLAGRPVPLPTLLQAQVRETLNGLLTALDEWNPTDRVEVILSDATPDAAR